jgi:hypothetical protein
VGVVDHRENDCEGQHWTKITDSESPSRCGQMQLHWPALKHIEAHSARIWVHIDS